MKKAVAVGWFDHRTDVPRWLAAGIGQIAIEWSVLEREIEEVIRVLSDADIGVTRVSTLGMNARTRMKVAANLIQFHVYHGRMAADGFKLWVDFQSRAEAVEANRNKVVHGLWTKQTQWKLLRTTANRNTTLHPDLKKMARAVIPEAEATNAASLEATTSEIVTLCQEATALGKTFGIELGPLRQTIPRYTRRHRRPKPQARKP